MPSKAKRFLNKTAYMVMCVSLLTTVATTSAQAYETPLSFDLNATSGNRAPAHSYTALSAHDEQLYLRIFALQENGDWKAAGKLINELNDNLLMGTLLAQRYLHPTKYRSHSAELRQWLQDYPDLPDAQTIYKLAKKRSYASTPVPRPVSDRVLRGRGGIDGGPLWLRGQVTSHLKLSDANTVRSLTRRFRRALRQGATLTAKRLLTNTNLTSLLTRTDTDRLRGALAFSYFLDGHDEYALKWAKPAANRSGQQAPQAAWAAGLSSWRTEAYNDAERYFGMVANSKKADQWTRSAGAYWAARSALRAKHPQAVNDWLIQAADNPRTFYGLIARRALGLPIGFGWNADSMSRNDHEILAQYPTGRRALALIQLGQLPRAEAELRQLYPNVDTETRQAIVSVSNESGLAGLSIRISADLQRKEGVVYDDARYPIPNWKPQDGWKLDRALIYAFARQESGFDQMAQSRAGARGLMQLMPSTARFISERDERRQGKKALLDPSFNLKLGQRYLQHLMDAPIVGENLFFLATAYNGGPGNLITWRNKAKFGNDPLLFIESLASRETRHYIERVVTNLWIYRMRLDQNTPSLDAVVAGQWPTYMALETRLAKHP